LDKEKTYGIVEEDLVSNHHCRMDYYDSCSLLDMHDSNTKKILGSIMGDSIIC
jgi:hypothetical protein